MQANTIQRGITFIMGILLCSIVAGGAAAQTSVCLSVDVAQPVIFPDGSTSPAGELTLCDWKSFTPVQQLHRSYIDGRPVQLMLGRRSPNERKPGDPNEVYFRQTEGGELQLLGYTRTFRGESVTVRFPNDFKNSPPVNRLARAEREQAQEPILIVMASPH